MVNVRIQYQISKVVQKRVDYCSIFKLVQMLRALKALVCLNYNIFNANVCFTLFAKCTNFVYFFYIENVVEELTCLATWKDGNSRYLVGLVSHHHAVSNEERYRCFVYEKILSSGN